MKNDINKLQKDLDELKTKYNNQKIEIQQYVDLIHKSEYVINTYKNNVNKNDNEINE